jgi:hypothetical protein
MNFMIHFWADYVILKITLYDINFHWWFDHTLVIVSKISLLNIIFEKLLNLPPQTLMSWNGLARVDYAGVHCLACPNELTWHLTEHDGHRLDHSIVHNAFHMAFSASF